MNEKWFESWFDSDYYHILYKKRDHNEADSFIKSICNHLHLGPSSKALDMACGKGRHAISLNKEGLDVTGIDLSKNSIEEAKKHANNTLRFDEFDMRKPYKQNAFDVVFSLFTSMGYFESPADDEQIIKAVTECLKPNGLFVLDYLNSNRVIATLKEKETRELNGIRFDILRRIVGKQVIKEITIKDGDQIKQFSEQVMLYKKEDLIALLEEAGLEILSIFGNYKLEPFDPINSDRVIVIAKKL